MNSRSISQFMASRTRGRLKGFRLPLSKKGPTGLKAQLGVVAKGTLNVRLGEASTACYLRFGYLEGIEVDFANFQTGTAASAEGSSTTTMCVNPGTHAVNRSGGFRSRGFRFDFDNTGYFNFHNLSLTINDDFFSNRFGDYFLNDAGYFHNLRFATGGQCQR
jgi:hypothetical protein